MFFMSKIVIFSVSHGRILNSQTEFSVGEKKHIKRKVSSQSCGIAMLSAREKKLADLKRGLAWKLCTDLLVPPLGAITATKAHRNDSGGMMPDMICQL